VNPAEASLKCTEPQLFCAERSINPPAILYMRLQSSFSKSTVGLHLLSHLDIVVPMRSLRRTISIPWNGNSYANARPGLHPHPCLRIRSNETSMYKHATQIRNPASRTLHHQNTGDGAVHGVSAAFKRREERKNPKPTKRQPPSLPADGNGTPLAHLNPVPGKGHIDAIYRALGRSKLFLKYASTLSNENTLEKRGRVNKAISCANSPARSLEVMADSHCTEQNCMIFSFSPLHFPFIEIQSRIVREQPYLFMAFQLS